MHKKTSRIRGDAPQIREVLCCLKQQEKYVRRIAQSAES